MEREREDQIMRMTTENEEKGDHANTWGERKYLVWYGIKYDIEGQDPKL